MMTAQHKGKNYNSAQLCSARCLAGPHFCIAGHVTFALPDGRQLSVADALRSLPPAQQRTAQLISAHAPEAPAAAGPKDAPTRKRGVSMFHRSVRSDALPDRRAPLDTPPQLPDSYSLGSASRAQSNAALDADEGAASGFIASGLDTRAPLDTAGSVPRARRYS